MEVWLTKAGPPWRGTKAKRVGSIRTAPTFEFTLPSGLGAPFAPLGSVASIAANASAVIEIVTMRLMKSVTTRLRKRSIIAQMAHGGWTREDAHGRP